MQCEFDPNKCSVTCKKYPICSYYSIQNQFIELQSQMNFIYMTISDILKTNKSAEIKISLLQETLENCICKDSELIEYFTKESTNEKENE